MYLWTFQICELINAHFPCSYFPAAVTDTQRLLIPRMKAQEERQESLHLWKSQLPEEVRVTFFWLRLYHRNMGCLTLIC